MSPWNRVDRRRQIIVGASMTQNRDDKFAPESNYGGKVFTRVIAVFAKIPAICIPAFCLLFAWGALVEGAPSNSLKNPDREPGVLDESDEPGEMTNEPDMDTLLGARLTHEEMVSLQSRWAAFKNSTVTWGREIGRKVTFTFDDGPSQAVTPLVMDYLEKHGLRGTFFVNGRRFTGGSAVAAKNREVLVEAARRGHLIGNHTQTHPMLKTLAPERQKWEVFTTHNAIVRVTGLRPYLYRPPFGGQTSYSRRILEKAGYATVMWNLSSDDPFGRHVAKVHRTVMQKIHRDNGGIILMHDTNGWAAYSIPLIVRSILVESCKLIHRGEEPYLIVGLDHFRVPEGETAPRPTPEGIIEAAHRRAETFRICGFAGEEEKNTAVGGNNTGESK